MAESRIPFIGRTDELRAGSRFITAAVEGGSSGTMVLAGRSGTGKSALCRRLLRTAVRSHPNALCLYLDLTDDEYATTNLFQTLIALAWAPRPFTDTLAVAVPDGAGFHTHYRQRLIRRALGDRVLRTVADSARLLPTIGSAIASLIPNIDDVSPTSLPADDLAMVLFSYFDRIHRHHPVILALDNYQFLPRQLRLILECRINVLDRRCVFLPVVRTEEASSADFLIEAFPAHQRLLDVLPFGRALTARLLRSSVPRNWVSEQLVDDAILKTRGNLKELEYYIRSLLQTGSGDCRQSRIDSLLDSISRLPFVERCLVSLVALFPAGIDLTHARRIISRLTTIDDPCELQSAVQTLVAIGYLVLNGVHGERLKAAHEKVITSIRNTIDEREFLALRASAVAAFEDLLASHVDWRERPYLLHCLVGAMTFHELRQRLGSVCALIDHQHRVQNYHYLVSLYEASPEMLPILPDHIAELFLDAFQKTSQFYLGMESIRALTATRPTPDPTLTLFLAKYLVQTYRFEQALAELATLPETEDVLLCRLNALQCLSRDDEARALIDARTTGNPASEAWHVILRNSAHLYPLPVALQHLQQAHAYFERVGSEHGAASVLNNLGVVHLWAADLESAHRTLQKSRIGMLRLASAEVYQPMVNLAVLAAVRGQSARALRLMGEARRRVPATLALDHIIIEENEILMELDAGRTTLQAAIERLRQLTDQSRGLPDPRMQEQLAFNLRSLETVAPNQPTKTPDDWFLDCIGTTERTGFEIRHLISFGGVRVEVLFILSPHWRH